MLPILALHEGMLFLRTDKARAKGRKAEGVGVLKNKELKLEETEASYTLGGAIKYTEIHQSRLHRPFCSS